MRDRLRLGFLQVLIAIDQLAYVLIAVPIYIVAGGPCPSADETISSRVGRAAVAGQRWGLVLEAVIDRLFRLLGEAPGHCRRNIETICAGDAPTI